MKKIYLVGVSLVTGLVMAGSVAGSAYAWHPEGKIKKYVQNQTVGGQLSDADSAAAAVATKPGDIVKYVIEVSNTAKPANHGFNDLAFIELTDKLPAGVELVNNPAQREIKANLGTLKPGQSATKEYLLRVVSKQDSTLVKNTACFSGDSLVKDHPQKGCDDAFVKVEVPQEPPKTPEEPKEPEQPEEPAEPQVLPVTGPSGLIGMAAGVSGLGYALHRLVARKR